MIKNTIQQIKTVGNYEIAFTELAKLMKDTILPPEVLDKNISIYIRIPGADRIEVNDFGSNLIISYEILTTKTIK